MTSTHLQQCPNVTAKTAHNVGKTTVLKLISEHSSQQTWGTQPVLGNEIIEKTYIDHAEEEKNTDFQTVREMSRLPSQNIKKTTTITTWGRPPPQNKSWGEWRQPWLTGRTTVLISTLKWRENYMTIPVYETAENENGPSQQIMDENAQLPAHCESLEWRNTCAWG